MRAGTSWITPGVYLLLLGVCTMYYGTKQSTTSRVVPAYLQEAQFAQIVLHMDSGGTFHQPGYDGDQAQVFTAPFVFPHGVCFPHAGTMHTGSPPGAGTNKPLSIVSRWRCLGPTTFFSPPISIQVGFDLPSPPMSHWPVVPWAAMARCLPPCGICEM